MRFSLFLSFFLFSCWLVSAQEAKLMSYNIRLNTPSDGEDNWEYRKQDLVKYITSKTPDFLGIQEALLDQNTYLDSALVDYQFIGVGRDDGKLKGEFMSIFYNDNKWKLIQDSTIWLSDQPQTVTKGWDAACFRTATIGTFENKDNNQRIIVINTHFDHAGQTARVKSAELLDEVVADLPSNLPIVLLGDFNVEPSNEAYSILTSTFTDTYDQRGRDFSGTFNGFQLEGPFSRRIDYIFHFGKGKVVKQTMETPKTENGRQLSDHFPIFCTLQF